MAARSSTRKKSTAKSGTKRAATKKPATKDEPKRTGRPPKLLTTADVANVERLAGYGLSLPQIAAVVGMSDHTLRDKLGGDEALSSALARGKAVAEGRVGKSLFEKALEGDTRAIQWWEGTRAGRKAAGNQEPAGDGQLDALARIIDASARLLNGQADHQENR